MMDGADNVGWTISTTINHHGRRRADIRSGEPRKCLCLKHCDNVVELGIKQSDD